MREKSLFKKIQNKRFASTFITVFLMLILAVSLLTDFFDTKKSADAAKFTLNAASGIDYIPAGAEGKELIIDGVTVYADKVGVWQNNNINLRTECKGESDTNNSDNSICDTKRIFESVKLIHGAVLTHENVVSSDLNNANAGQGNPNSVADDSSGSARWKKVDIVSLGNFEIKDTSNINVNGKGYPGGNTDGHIDGYGPANGFGLSIDEEGRVGAYGGGYRGDGGRGHCYNNGSGQCTAFDGSSFEGLAPRPGGVRNYSEIEFDFGSGGGSANQWKNNKPALTPGSAGGGRVRIDSSSILSISTQGTITANGIDALYEHGGEEDEREIGGAGAGGSIVLTGKIRSASDSRVPTGTLGISADGGKMRQPRPAGQSGDDARYFDQNSSYTNVARNWENAVKYGVGGDGYVANPTGKNLTNIYANGGDSWALVLVGSEKVSIGGAGGGGNIIINDSGSPITVKKILEARRRGGEINVDFNPYSLQKDDQVRVVILATNIEAGVPFEIEDEYLSTPDGSSLCKPFSINDSGVDSGGSVIWSYTPSTGETIKTFSFDCKVE